MSNEEFQRLVLEKLDKLEKKMDQAKDNLGTSFDNVSSRVVTREELECLEKVVNKLAATQTTQGESINILALRQLQTEADVATLKKAK